MFSQNRRWLNIAAILAIVALIGVVVVGCEQDKEKPKPADKTTEQDDGQPADGDDDGKIKKVDADTFEVVVLNADRPVLVDFYADWCGPCRALHPTLEEIAAEYAGRAMVAQVDVDENGGLASHYNVRGIPALFVIKDGKVVDQTVGLQSKQSLSSMLDKHLG